MSTRRSFLQSALLLPSLFAVNAFAQDAAKSSGTVTFADFESGDYSDWTTTGDAFGSRPATDALFPGKVKGFGGRAYASTFSPRRGVLAMGKAVSREFVVEKPVITFRIGGGNFPGQACLNLVVDGKIERTETGDGTAQLVGRSWDVSALVGKTARLEIVDSTQSERRGYVMVDDIQFGDGAPPGGRLLQVPNIESYRFYSQSVFANKDIAAAFGTTNKVLDRIEYDIWQRCLTPDLKHNPGESMEQLVVRLKNASLSVRDVSEDKPVYQFALACIISAWVKSHMRSLDLDKGVSLTGFDLQGNVVEFERYRSISPKKILQCVQIEGVCRHSATLIRSIALRSGLKCRYAAGSLRKFDGILNEKELPNHGWNVFDFGNIVLPSDGTPHTKPNSNEWARYARTYYPSFALDVLPRDPIAIDLFLARRYDDNGSGGYEDEDAEGVAHHRKSNGKSIRDGDDKLQNISYTEWFDTDIRRLNEVQNALYRSRKIKS